MNSLDLLIKLSFIIIVTQVYSNSKIEMAINRVNAVYISKKTARFNCIYISSYLLFALVNHGSSLFYIQNAYFLNDKWNDHLILRIIITASGGLIWLLDLGNIYMFSRICTKLSSSQNHKCTATIFTMIFVVAYFFQTVQ